MAAEIALLLLCNGLYLYEKDSDRGRLYRVEANRIVREMRDRKLTEEEIISYDLSAYQTIVGIRAFSMAEVCNHDYVV